MPKIAKHADDMTLDELRRDSARLEREIESAHKKNRQLDDRIDDLQVEINELNEKLEDNNAEFLRDQLDTLAVDPPTATPEQLTRLYSGILRGEDWRHGTWR